jgi:hypothetical protein
VDEAKAAIDRYSSERNGHFRDHPRRAGGKVWERNQRQEPRCGPLRPRIIAMIAAARVHLTEAGLQAPFGTNERICA